MRSFFNIDLPIFDRNQGEIARTRFAITQAEEQAIETAQQVNTDIVDAYAAIAFQRRNYQAVPRGLRRSGQTIARHHRIRL